MPPASGRFGITVDASGNRAYTANVKSDDVSVIDIAAQKAIATVKVGHRPYAVALAQGRAFVTDQHAGTVTVFDTVTFQVLKTIPVGGYPEGIMANDDEKIVYVTCWDDNAVHRIDVAALKVTGRVEVGNGPRAFGKFLK